jgi:uncharacterized Ntn-hydrolase superfamily protein
VLADTYAAYVTHAELPLPERLLIALDAGDAVGGDKRGRQSAALVMVTTEDFPDLSIRVDDHGQPLDELRRLYEIWLRERAPGLKDQPSKARPSGTVDMDAIEARWKRQGLDLKFRR